MRILYVTSEWPTDFQPWAVPFLVSQVNALRKNGIDVEVFPFRGQRKFGNYIGIYRQLHKKIRNGNYDLVHAHWGHSGFLASLPKRIPLVVTFHGSDLYGIYMENGHYHPISYPLRLAMQWVAFTADQIILVSERMRRFIFRHDFQVIPVGIDLELFRPIPQEVARQQLGWELNRTVVLFVGSPANPVKRYWLAQKVVESLPKTADVELVTVTNKPPAMIPVFLNAADALLITSKHEGSPTIVKEAMACCLPIVSIDVGDVRERLEKVTGCAVSNSQNPIDIARQLESVLGRRERTNGWIMAQALDTNRLAQQQIGVYERALSKS